MRLFFHKLNPVSFFVFAAVVCEILFSLSTSPLQAPDEFNHFYRAYQVSEGYFLPQQHDKRLGGEIPYNISDFCAPFRKASVISGLRPSAAGDPDLYTLYSSGETMYRDFPNTAYYCPVSYLPQAFVIGILNRFDVSAAVLYHAGRLSIFIVYLFSMVTVLRLIPIYKWLFAFLALLPMNLFIVNSFSADTVTNILSFLFMALVFKSAFAEEKISRRLIFCLAFIAGLLALAKLVYVALVILLFIIPGEKFQSRKQQVLSIAGIFAVAFLLVFAWSSVVTSHYLSYKDYNPVYRDSVTLSQANYDLQKAYILQHPGYFPEVIVKSIFNPEQTYLASYIGRFGAFLDVPMASWLIWAAYLLVLFITLSEKNKFRVTVRQRIILFISAFSCFILLLLSQHLTWDPVGYGRVDLIQGRYLVPLFPLLFIGIGNPFRKLEVDPKAWVVAGVLVLNGFAFWTLYERYVYQPYDEVIHFTCDAEKLDEHGNFKTSSPSIVLLSCSNQSSVEKRSGNFSAIVSQSCPYSFTYVFKGFNKGDLVNISAWKKGDATLAISAGRTDCGKFYDEFGDEHYTDRQGWKNLHALYVISQPCDTMDVVFFVRSKHNQVTYVDDLTFTLKKKNKF